MNRLLLALVVLVVACRLGDSFKQPQSAARDMSTPDVGDLHMLDLSMAQYVDLPPLVGDLTVVHDLAEPPRDFTGITIDMTPLTPCQSVTVSTLAGNGLAGFLDGTGGANGTTKFNGPQGLATDSSGNVYVADCNNNRLRIVAPDGSTTTVAGNGTAAIVNGTLGASGTTELSCPTGVALDSAGNIYVDDVYTDIRKISGLSISTLSTSIPISPWSVVSFAGTLYVSSAENNQIVAMPAAGGNVSILSGNGTKGFLDTDGSNSEFNFPLGIAVDSSGSVYVADSGNNRLRVIAPGGATSTLAGNGAGGFADGTGGPNGTTEFQALYAAAVDSASNVYVADKRNNRVRMTSPNGTTVTIAGGDTSGFKDGSGCVAQFNSPTGVAVAGKLLYVSESDNNRIRKIQLP